MASTGNQLKNDLGLSKFPYVMIQKVIDFPIAFFIVTIDSRYPTVYLTYTRIKKAKFASLGKMKVKGEDFELKNFRLTPSFPIEELSIVLPSNAIILVKDLAGEYLRNKSLYECRSKKFIK